MVTTPAAKKVMSENTPRRPSTQGGQSIFQPHKARLPGRGFPAPKRLPQDAPLRMQAPRGKQTCHAAPIVQAGPKQAGPKLSVHIAARTSPAHARLARAHPMARTSRCGGRSRAGRGSSRHYTRCRAAVRWPTRGAPLNCLPGPGVSLPPGQPRHALRPTRLPGSTRAAAMWHRGRRADRRMQRRSHTLQCLGTKAGRGSAAVRRNVRMPQPGAPQRPRTRRVRKQAVHRKQARCRRPCRRSRIGVRRGADVRRAMPAGSPWCGARQAAIG